MGRVCPVGLWETFAAVVVLIYWLRGLPWPAIATRVEVRCKLGEQLILFGKICSGSSEIFYIDKFKIGCNHNV